MKIDKGSHDVTSFNGNGGYVKDTKSLGLNSVLLIIFGILLVIAIIRISRGFDIVSVSSFFEFLSSFENDSFLKSMNDVVTNFGDGIQSLKVKGSWGILDALRWMWNTSVTILDTLVWLFTNLVYVITFIVKFLGYVFVTG